MTKNSTQYVHISPFAIGTFATGTDSFVLAGLLSSIGSDLHVSVAAAGQLITVFALTYALCAPLASIITNRFSQSSVAQVGLVIFIVANILSALSPNFILLMLTRILAGVGASLFTPNATAAATRLVSAHQRGKALSIVLGGMTIGVVAGVPLGTWIGQLLSWHASLLFIAGLASVALIGIRCFIPTLDALPAITLKQRLSLLKHGPIIRMVLFMLMASAASICVYTYVDEVLTATAHITQSMLFIALSCWGAGGVIGSTASGPLTDRFGSNKVLCVATMFLIGTLLSFSLVHSPIGAFIILFLNGIAAWSFSVPNNHRLTALATSAPSIVVSYNSAGIYAGQALGAVLGGLFLARGFAPELLPCIGAILGVLTLIMLGFTMQATEQKQI